MKKLIAAVAMFAMPFAVLAQDVPDTGWDVDQIITAVVVAVLAFVGGWLMKGLQALEKFVASTKTQADDEVLKKVKEVLAGWSKPAE